ncbi:MAG: DUF1553 domain-containing protein, partial [Planctomycetota bacterium]|nr:DUF1553 domain-containing protein [Planctomycetota bacterium]
QALVVWNDPQFHEAAQALARRVAGADARTSDDAERVRWLWRQCLLREPSASERGRLLELLREERRHFAAEPAAATALAGDTADAAELAAWTVLVGVVINLDEFLTRR